jgi:hypothetical protein
MKAGGTTGAIGAHGLVSDATVISVKAGAFGIVDIRRALRRAVAHHIPGLLDSARGGARPLRARGIIAVAG